MAFGPAVFAAVHHLHTKMLTSEFLYALSERTYIPLVGRVVKNIKNAYEALKLHMLDLVSLSRAWVAEGKLANMDAGLLRNLVEANVADQATEDTGAANSHKRLTDDELFSNTFCES
jgi:hypothetical protein